MLSVVPRGQHSGNLAVFRKPIDVEFRKDLVAIDGDVENSMVTFDQFAVRREFPRDFGRQTGGLRQVVSTTAVGDRDLHDGENSSVERPIPAGRPGRVITVRCQLP